MSAHTFKYIDLIIDKTIEKLKLKYQVLIDNLNKKDHQKAMQDADIIKFNKLVDEKNKLYEKINKKFCISYIGRASHITDATFKSTDEVNKIAKEFDDKKELLEEKRLEFKVKSADIESQVLISELKKELNSLV